MSSAFITCEVPIFYATTEGQTQRIAGRLAGMLRQLGLDSRAFDVAGAEARAVDWSRVRAAIVGASLHAGRHQRAAALFVRAHAAELNRKPSAFFSVSLSAGSRKPQEVAAARRIANAFPRPRGWSPQIVVCFAGALAYTRYGRLKRFLLQRIARAQGAPTDASRDHEFTDWTDVQRLASTVAALVRERNLDARHATFDAA